MSAHCVDGGALVGMDFDVPADTAIRQTAPYGWVGCNRIFCEDCGCWVRHVDRYRIVTAHAPVEAIAALYDDLGAAPQSPLLFGEPRYRTYLCRCRWSDTANVRSIVMLAFDSWSCAGHS